MAQTKVQLLMPNLGDVIDFDSSTLFMDGADNRVGIRNTNPQYELDVTGTVRATNFIGTGSTTIPDWIVHDGDTNTKFGFPANDKISFHTSGSERLHINATGYLGINDGGPNARLVVRGDSDTSDADCQLRIYDIDSTAGSQIPSVSFWGPSTEIGRIRGTDTQGMKFYTANSGTLGDRMSIGADGNVHINTLDNATANAKLNIENSTNNTSIALKLINKPSSANGKAILQFYAETSSGQGCSPYIQSVSGTDAGGSNSNNDGGLEFHTTSGGSGTDINAMYISAAGNIGIGTTTAGRAGADELTIGNASGDIGITLRSGTTNEGNIYFSESLSAGNAEQRGIVRFDHDDDSMQFWTANGNNWPTEKLRITSGGQVNIGGNYTQTFNTLNVTGNIKSTTRFNLADSVYLWTQNRMSLGNSYIIESQQNTPFAILTQGVAQPIVFGTNSAERLRIDSSGRLLLGLTSSIGGHAIFQVQGSGNRKAHFHQPDTGSCIVQFTNTTTGTSTSDGAIIGLDGDESLLISQKENNHIAIHTNNTEKLRITSSGNLLLGTTTASSELTVRGGGTVAAFEGTGGNGSIMISDVDNTKNLFLQNSNGVFNVQTSGGSYANKFSIDESGNVTIGSHNAGNTFTEFGSNTGGLTIDDAGHTNTGLRLSHGSDDTYLVQAGNGNFYMSAYTDNDMIFGCGTSGNERLRITSSGRLLYGDHRNDRGAELQYEGSQHQGIGIHRNTADHGAPAMVFSASRGTSAGSNTIVQSGDYIGMITFKGADGSDLASGAYITAIVDGTPGSNDMPTRLGFWTSADGSQSPTERLRIDSSGRLLIGTTTAGDAYGDNITIDDTNAGITLRSSTSGVGSLYFADGTSGSDKYRGWIEYWHNGNFFKFSTDATERMRINSAGRVCIGTTNDDGGGAANTDNGVVIKEDGQVICRRDAVMYTAKSLATGGYTALRTMSAQTQVGSISFNSGGTSFNTSSDYRRKENLAAITDGITKVKQLKTYRFNFKDNPSEIVDGFLAHEAQAVVPHAVVGTKDQEATPADVADDKATDVGDPIYQVMDQSKLVPLLTAALQEAITKIETLEAKVAALESS